MGELWEEREENFSNVVVEGTYYREAEYLVECVFRLVWPPFRV